MKRFTYMRSFNCLRCFTCMRCFTWMKCSCNKNTVHLKQDGAVTQLKLNCNLISNPQLNRVVPQVVFVYFEKNGSYLLIMFLGLV